jgi:hypothetical protein
MGTLDRFTFSSAPIKRVKSVQFSIWDPDEIVSCVCGPVEGL